MSTEGDGEGPTPSGFAAAAQVMPLTMPYYFGAPWVPSYKGEPHSLRDFKDKMLAMFRLYPATPEQKVEILIGQLQGAALREVKSWPPWERKTVEQILERLNTIFDTRTVSELKMRFFSRKQQPYESLRDYALSLQEAFNAIRQADPTEVTNADKTLREKFIEGVTSESIKQSLKILSLQLPDCSFLDFKESAIKVLSVQVPSNAPHNYESTPVQPSSYRWSPEDCHTREVALYTPAQTTVAQCAQIQAQDTIKELCAQVTELTKGLVELHKEVKELKHQPNCADDAGPMRELSRYHPRDNYRPGRRSTDQFDSLGRPICRRCKRSGHIERECRRLNWELLGAGTTSQEKRNA